MDSNQVSIKVCSTPTPFTSFVIRTRHDLTTAACLRVINLLKRLKCLLASKQAAAGIRTFFRLLGATFMQICNFPLSYPLIKQLRLPLFFGGKTVYLGRIKRSPQRHPRPGAIAADEARNKPPQIALINCSSRRWKREKRLKRWHQTNCFIVTIF